MVIKGNKRLFMFKTKEKLVLEKVSREWSKEFFNYVSKQDITKDILGSSLTLLVNQCSDKNGSCLGCKKEQPCLEAYDILVNKIYDSG